MQRAVVVCPVGSFLFLFRQLGVVPRVIAQLFSQLEDSVISGSILNYDAAVSFLQIYNEQVGALGRVQCHLVL